MKYTLLLLVLFTLTKLLTAQDLDSSKIKAGWGTLNFSVPQAPALIALGASTDNLLKPTSVRAAAFSIGNYLLTNGSVIPKDLAVEISPMLLNSKVTLYDYNKHKFWYRSRLSLGSQQSTATGSFELSEGLRFTLIDKTDLRTNKVFLNKLQTYLINDAVSLADARKPFLNDDRFKILLEKYNIITPQNLNDALADDSKADLIKAFNDYVDELNSTRGIPPDYVEKLRDKVRDSLWNAPIWELAAALVETSPDSLIQDIKTVNKFDVWSTVGLPVMSKGQILLGLKYEGAKDSINQWQSNLSLGFRFYYGANDVRGYVQAQFDRVNKENTGMADAGCEFTITNGLWANAGASFKLLPDGNTSFVPQLSIKFGTPEKKHN